MRTPAALVLLGLLGAACAATGLRRGESGPVAWEVLDKAQTEAGVTYTIVLRETAGTGIQFTTVQTGFPLPPTGYGIEWYGGIGKAVFAHRLEPHGEVRANFRPRTLLTAPEYADLEFRGADDTGKPIRVKLRVYMR